MNVVVTGGTGFVGTNLIIRLLKDGHKVVSFDNYSTGLKENEQEGCTYYDVNLADVTDYSSYMDKPDVIFHMAALARIQPSIVNPHITLQNNFMSTLNVLEYARKNNTPVVYAGSSTRHHGFFKSPYAWSKLAGEHLCELYSKVYNLNTSICRFYNVYGPYQLLEGTYAAIVGIFQTQYLNGKPLTITADGEQRRDFTYIDDIVDGLVRCSSVDGFNEFELGTGVNYSINELANMFGDVEKKYIPARPGEYDKTLCDYSKAKKELGYNPQGNLKQYMKKWLSENEKVK